MIGAEFQKRVLEAILPVVGQNRGVHDRLDVMLYNLESTGFLKEVESKRKGDRRFSFTHSTLQEV